MCLVNVTSTEGAGACADDGTDANPAMAKARGTAAAIPRRCRFMGGGYAQTPPSSTLPRPCKIPRLVRSKG